MVESNVTRRRVLQGAGAIGVASLGSTVISAQEGDGGGGDQGAAIRVAHASPDAPNVDVRLTSQDGGGAAGGGNETGGGDANETGDGQDGGGQGGDADTEIGGVGFRDVSGYNEIDPGSYQVQIVPAEGGLLEGFVDDLFGGGGEDEETVLFEDQIDVEEGTTYTLVAFGEVAQGPVPAEGAEMDDGGAAGQNETDGGMGGTETGGAGQNETDGAGMDANESDGGVAGQNETGGAGQNETDGAGAGGATGQDDQLISELGFGESQSVEVDPGDYSLEVREAGAAGTTGGTDDGMAGNETGAGQNETDGVAGQNETDGGMAGQNETGGVGENESDAAGAGDTAGQSGGADRGFQVQVLEDDVSDPGDETARVRVFHAVPDVDTVSVVRISEGGIAQGGDGGNETGGTGGAGNETDGIGGDEGAGQEEGEGGAGGDGAGQDDGVGAGQGDGGAGQQENETVATDGAAQQQEGARRAQLSTDANTVYSGFAVGYFDPQAAATASDPSGDDGGAAGNDTDGMGGDGGAGQEEGDGAGAAQNESDEGIGGGQQGDDGNATGNETGGEGEQIAEDAEGEQFELLTVEDAQGGERSDGGTGGLLDLAAVADD